MRSELSKMEKNEIERKAHEVLEFYREYVPGKGYVDATKLVSLFGFNVLEDYNLPLSEDGCITVSASEDVQEIKVNGYRSIERKRFIIAHELAHYLLHYKGDGKLFRHRENIKGKDLEENDADYFAACLLMPTDSFKSSYLSYRQLYSYPEMVRRLELDFKTPRESILRRIEEVQ